MALHVILPVQGRRSLVDFIRAERDQFESLLLEHGAVLFRGFDIRSAPDFQTFSDALGVAPVDYVYRSTPRTHLGGSVYTATEYPSRLEIPLHCENAYQRVWPRWISFCCLTPAKRGGQTPIANMRDVTAAIDPRIVESFATRKIKYVRHYRPNVDLSWQVVFRTEDREGVAQFCQDNGLDHEWLDGGILRTEQVCQGVAEQPETKSTVFFNQAHLFHISNLDPAARTDMISFFGYDRLPRNAFYGDGGEIPAEDLEQVRAAFRSAAVDLAWQAGDVVVLDNMQYAHGRRSYSGERRVLTSLLKPHTPAA